MKYPSCYLMEPGARGEMLSLAFAGPARRRMRRQDGSLCTEHDEQGHIQIHQQSGWTCFVPWFAQGLSRCEGRSIQHGLRRVLLDPKSRSDTYPTIEIDEDDVTIGHEASVSKVGEEQLFYLKSCWPQRRGSYHDGRLWFHRAARQGTSDGIRS